MVLLSIFSFSVFWLSAASNDARAKLIEPKTRLTFIDFAQEFRDIKKHKLITTLSNSTDQNYIRSTLNGSEIILNHHSMVYEST